MADNAKRSGIALGIAVMAIGYNMLPIKAPPALLEASGLIIMFMGAVVITNAISTKSQKS